MNYFDFHISDYLRKTAHLTLAEHGAYSLLLYSFYSTEKALPTKKAALYRLARAGTAGERKAVDSVVAEFWKPTPVGLVNSRAIEHIDKYRKWLEKQRSNGSQGGRPPKEDKAVPDSQSAIDRLTKGLTQTKPKDNPGVSSGLTQTITQTEPKQNPTGGIARALPLPTSHSSLPTPERLLTNGTHTPVSAQGLGRRDSNEDQGSVCGTFKKIGGEKNP